MSIIEYNSLKNDEKEKYDNNEIYLEKVLSDIIPEDDENRILLEKHLSSILIRYT